MKRVSICFVAITLVFVAMACSRANKVSYKDAVQQALEQADLKGISVSEDKDHNTITLTGKLHSDDAKQQATQVAQSVAPNRTIANEISIEPVGVASEAKKIESNVDSGIESNYKAALIANGLSKQDIRYSAKNGVLILKGKVKAADQKQEAEQVASSVPNVAQVVDQIEVSR
jgi:osmotically-inducible protein OsmY